ncbi:hypothetical protein E3N88_39877 [Mikania micrantha]|uniref:Uncharacterized protein n=1 Tax=Mikania micrantha TaxID=192012 RepID=A0A5N6LL13_9ASTR|nr:hypothetical protein E3N88_39877 [Mikania micrantha]
MSGVKAFDALEVNTNVITPPLTGNRSQQECSVVEKEVEDIIRVGPADLGIATKFKWLKYRIKDWIAIDIVAREGQYLMMKKHLEDLEKLVESRPLATFELTNRADCKKSVATEDLRTQKGIHQNSRVRWAIEGPFSSRFPNLFMLESSKTSSIASRFSFVNGCLSWKPLLKRVPTTPIELQELHHLTSILGSISLSSGSDLWLWSFDTTGSFSVKSIKKQLQSHNSVSPAFCFS